jgi:NhaA family Na+:H+ antiporter
VRLAVKPQEYSWPQMTGAGALAGIGFTMSLYIAAKAFPDESDFAAAKIGIFLASLIAGGIGTALLWSAAGSAKSSAGDNAGQENAQRPILDDSLIATERGPVPRNP